jgi:hypothetical protein
MPEVSLFSDILFDLSAAADPTFVPKLLYSRKEAAHAISVSVRSIDAYVRAGRLKIRKIGGRILIPIESLTSFASRDHATLP